MSQISPKLERGVVAAACQVDGLTFSLPSPARHHDILRSMHFMGLPAGCEHQGFLDHRGVFLSRKSAMIMAHQFGQLSEGEYEEGGDLYSEHLW